MYPALAALLLLAPLQPMNPTDDKQRSAFHEAMAADWQTAFEDTGTDPWQDGWFLDGKKATVENHDDGIHFSAGPDEGDNASHAVLWTRESFSGDIKLAFDYKRTDQINRWVNIIYLQATGTDEPPYHADIAEWSDLRDVPAMKTYFDHMNLLHISFSAYGRETSPVQQSYIRARRYPRAAFGGSFEKMELEPDFHDTGLFLPGKPYHVVVVKKSQDMWMHVTGDDQDRLYHWDLQQVPPVDHGRVGFRLMWTRAAVFSNIVVSSLPDGGDDSANQPAD